MRLWHEDLIQYLPRQQLLGQHRECCALRGQGWGKPHSVVNYVFTHPSSSLFRYHELILREMESRGYHVEPSWKNPLYRGKKLGYVLQPSPLSPGLRYPEHDSAYFIECLENLKRKGISIPTKEKVE